MGEYFERWGLEAMPGENAEDEEAFRVLGSPNFCFGRLGLRQHSPVQYRRYMHASSPKVSRVRYVDFKSDTDLMKPPSGKSTLLRKRRGIL